MKKSVIAAVVVIALAGLGVGSVPLAESYVAGRIKSEIARGGEASVDSVEVGLWDRRVTLINLQSHQDGDLTARRLEASGLSGAFSDFMQGHTPLSDFRPGEPLHADRLELRDARLVDQASGASWSVKSLVVQGLDLARYDAAVDGPYRLPILYARIAGALSLRHLEGGNYVYTAPGTGDTLGLGKVAIDGFDRGKISAIVIGDLEATPKAADEVAFKVADLTLKNTNLSPILTPLSSASWIPGVPLGRIDVASLSGTGFGGTLLSRYGISLGSVSTESTHESVDVSRSRVHVENLVLAPGTDVEAIKFRLLLQAMGLNELRFDFDCAGTEQRRKGELVVDRCRLASPDLGDLTLAARFVNADESFWRAVDGGGLLAMAHSSIALGGATLNLADKGIVDRSMRAVAGATGQSPTVARAKLVQEIQSYQPANVLITEDLTKLLNTVARFVEKGGTLIVEARPDPPVGLAQAGYLRLAGPDLVSLFGLSARLSP